MFCFRLIVLFKLYLTCLQIINTILTDILTKTGVNGVDLKQIEHYHNVCAQLSVKGLHHDQSLVMLVSAT